MEIFLRKYFWTVNLVTIAVCAGLAAHGIGQVVMAQVPRSSLRPGPEARVAALFRTPEVAPIVTRNIFCSSCEPAPESGPAAAEQAAVRTPLKLTLIATLVSEDERWSYATIRDPEDERTRLYGIGSRLPGEAVVTDIEDREVTVRRGGRIESLTLAQQEEAAPPPKPAARARRAARPRRGMENLAKAIRKVGPTHWEIERKALNEVLSNPTKIARSARIVPAVRNGKPNGFRLFAIRPGSFYALLGIRSGDTVQAVNGHPITTPDKALEIYTKLRSASHVAISFTRRGKPMTHEYSIR